MQETSLCKYIKLSIVSIQGHQRKKAFSEAESPPSHAIEASEYNETEQYSGNSKLIWHDRTEIL